MTGAADTVGADTLKERAASTVARDHDTLIGLSHRIHAKPELGFEEENASAWCAEQLAEAGLSVVMGICDLPTAFVATAGSGPFVLAICAEYDALPDIGHACGHNVIASAAIGAGRALAPLADDLGITIKVLGTPAEEGGGGKVLMLERGGFDGVNAAMMVHPAPGELDRMPCLAVEHFDVVYRGKEAHASAFPERGINAADALTVAQVAIGLLRQHADFGDQVHGIVTLGGAAPNIVPAHTEAKYYVRARTLKALETWSPRVKRCFEAGALATGCGLEIVPQGPTYSEFRTDEAMANLYRANATALGRVFPPPGDRIMSGSTDMANVSLAIPSIHPMLGLDSFPAVNHQPEFTAAAGGAIADQAVLDGATAMAWTVIDLASSEDERTRLTSQAFCHDA
ncbi:MAG TPA: M20 family metallopeptidase [Acidimicrobiales bacterium]|nr:M20 family metallopeptidase [Acidimicrobiales bacterium]